MRISLALAAALVAGGLAMPAPAAACLCGGQGQGDVAFVGTVHSAGFLRDLTPFASDLGGTWNFEIESVVVGDPGDGRVFSPSTSCYRSFEIGGTYLVHAEIVDPTQPYQQHMPGVPLVTTHCMRGAQISPPPPGSAILRAAQSWAVVTLVALLAVLSVGSVRSLIKRARPTAA